MIIFVPFMLVLWVIIFAVMGGMAVYFWPITLVLIITFIGLHVYGKKMIREAEEQQHQENRRITEEMVKRAAPPGMSSGSDAAAARREKEEETNK